MRAFKPFLPARWLCVVLALCAINVVLCSSVATTAFARTRPPVDMGDPDPTEGSHPSKAARVTSPHFIPNGHSTKDGISEPRWLVKDYVLVWRWISSW